VVILDPATATTPDLDPSQADADDGPEPAQAPAPDASGVDPNGAPPADGSAAPEAASEELAPTA
jgi:hypothetical protein